MTILSVVRMRRWFRYAVEYTFASGIGQVLGMTAGLIYVRVLSVEQYSLYGLILTTIIFLNLLSDVGLTQAVSFFWRHATAANQRFGAYLYQIRRIRWLLFAIAGLIASAGFLIATRGFELDWGANLAAIAMIVLSAMAMLEFALAQAILKLEGRYRRSYINDFCGQATRFFVAAMMLVALPATALWAAFGSAVGALMAFLATRVGNPLRRHLSTEDEGEAPAWPGRSVLRYVAPLTPNVVVFAMQDTLLYWNASARGGEQVMAEVFALGRINAILAVASGFLIAVVMPRLANVGDDRTFARYYWYLQSGALVLGVVLVGATIMLPQPFLWIIGSNYMGSGGVLPLMIGSYVFTVLMSIAGLCNRLRGWVHPEPYIALIQFVALLAVVVFFPFDSADNVALAFLLLNGLLAVLMVGVSVAGLRWYASLPGQLFHEGSS